MLFMIRHVEVIPMKVLIAALCLLPLLSGCAQGDAAPLARTQVQDQPPAATYASALLPLFAGAYGGKCRLLPSAARAPDFRVARDGRVAAPGMEHDLAEEGVQILMARKFIDGKPSEAHVIAGRAAPKWGLFLSTGAEEKANFGHEGAAVRCGASDTLRSLKGRSLHAAIGAWLVAPPRRLDCIVAMRERKVVAYRADTARIELDGHLFSFNQGVEAEQVTLNGGLAYKLDYAGGVRIIVTLDRQGRLAEVSASAPGTLSYYCSA
jgi:hypothetical protein